MGLTPGTTHNHFPGGMKPAGVLAKLAHGAQVGNQAGMQLPDCILMTADGVGGVWTYCMELIRGLQPFGIRVALAVMGGRLNERQYAQARALENVQLFESEYALEWMETPWRDVEAAGHWLMDIAEQVQPALVHLNGYTHANLAWDVPVIVVAHSCVLSWWEAVKAEKLPTYWDEYRHHVQCGLQCADLVVAPSVAMLRSVTRHYAFGAPCRVIANGRSGRSAGAASIPGQKAFSARLDGCFRPVRKEPLIVASGRGWDEAKNLTLLDRIAPYLHWPVSIYGPDTESLAGGSGRGMLGSAELAGELARAAIYAAPVLYEPFGLGILEAARCGCALVLSDIASLRENWEGAALFADPRDEKAWCGLLNLLIADEDVRKELGRNARKRARQFTARRMARQYARTYSAVLAGDIPRREVSGGESFNVHGNTWTEAAVHEADAARIYN